MHHRVGITHKINNLNVPAAFDDGLLAVEAAAGLFEPTAPLAVDAFAAEVDAFEVDGFEVDAFEAVDAFKVDAFEAVDAFEVDAFVDGFSGVAASALYTSRRSCKRSLS
jgi:hypothetical protein